jgi:hypothetical protein
MDGGIKFWLNPTEQDLYRPGWYTIDELIAWTHDTGPVMIEDLDDHGVTITWLSSSDESAVNPVDALLSRA